MIGQKALSWLALSRFSERVNVCVCLLPFQGRRSLQWTAYHVMKIPEAHLIIFETRSLINVFLNTHK